jgi:hypothetical protein
MTASIRIGGTVAILDDAGHVLSTMPAREWAGSREEARAQEARPCRCSYVVCTDCREPDPTLPWNVQIDIGDL